MINPIESVNKNDVKINMNDDKIEIKTKFVRDESYAETKININNHKNRGEFNTTYINPDSNIDININTIFNASSINKIFKRLRSWLR